jgi:transcriptional regulator with XRE-family HTH domain
MEHIYLNIKHLRSDKKMSQTQLEKELGLKRGVVSSYERGINPPPLQFLIDFSDYFQVSIDDLLRLDLSKEGEQANEPKQLYTPAPQSNILRIIEEEWQEVKQEMEDLKERMRRLEESG